MKVFLIALTMAVAASAAITAGPSNPDVITAYDYHRKIGIPKAQLMKQAEINSQARISNGAVTDITEVPYQVGLVIRVLFFFESVCGGSLISSTRVLTAAHCDNDGIISAQSFTVVLGSNTLFLGGQRLTTTDVTVHPNYFPPLAWNDCAMLRIPSITFTHAIKSIALPSGAELGNAYVGHKALASGYGLTADDGNIGIDQVISSVHLDVVENKVCVDVYSISTTSSNLCTKTENSASVCSGDSGGPLAIESNGRPILVGITSYGHKDGCTLGHPTAFARVTAFVPWIISQM